MRAFRNGKRPLDEKAEERLHDAHKRIAEDSIHFARQTILGIIKSAKALEAMPRIGRMVPEFNRDDVREVFHKNYRIVYKTVSNRQIDILTVAYGTVPLEMFGPFPELDN